MTKTLLLILISMTGTGGVLNLTLRDAVKREITAVTTYSISLAELEYAKGTMLEKKRSQDRGLRHQEQGSGIQG